MNKYKVTYEDGEIEIVEADFLNSPSALSSHYEFHRWHSVPAHRMNKVHLTLHPDYVVEIRLLEAPSDPKTLTIGERRSIVPSGDSVIIVRNGMVTGSYELLSEE